MPRLSHGEILTAMEEVSFSVFGEDFVLLRST
jgi:hypothetical protein